MPQPSDSASGLFFDFSQRLKLRLSGGDVFRFLNGQITNDLKKATTDSSIQASVLNAKGKLNAVVVVNVDGDTSFLLDSDSDVAGELPARIERYIIADDVQIEDVTSRFGIFHVIATTERLPDSISAWKIVRAIRFRQPGWDIWFEHTKREPLFAEFSRRWTFCDEDCAELLRIEQGIPRWGRELTGEIIPTEANLESISIDYAKGCYIGQEVISRIKSSGQTNKRLCGFVSISGEPLRPGMYLTTNDGENREVGWITSARHSPRLNQQLALGYAKRGYFDEGARFRALSSSDPADAPGIPIEVVALPFIQTLA